MKSLLIKTLSVSLLLSAAMPFDVQAFSFDYVKHTSRLVVTGVGIFLFSGAKKIGAVGLQKAAKVVMENKEVTSMPIKNAIAIVSEARSAAMKLAVLTGLGITTVEVARYNEVSKKRIPAGVGAGLGVGVANLLLNEAAKRGSSSSVSIQALVTVAAAVAGAKVGEDAIAKICWPKKDSNEQTE